MIGTSLDFDDYESLIIFLQERGPFAQFQVMGFLAEDGHDEAWMLHIPSLKREIVYIEEDEE